MPVVTLADATEIGLNDGLLVVAVVLINAGVHREDRLEDVEHFRFRMLGRDEVFPTSVLRMVATFHVASMFKAVDEDGGRGGGDAEEGRQLRGPHIVVADEVFQRRNVVQPETQCVGDVTLQIAETTQHIAQRMGERTRRRSEVPPVCLFGWRR